MKRVIALCVGLSLLPVAPALEGCTCTGAVVSPSLEITVTNAASGAAIDDATVSAVDPDANHVTATLATDDAGPVGGRYVLWNGAGQYTVTVSRAGFQSVTRALTATGEGGCGGHTSRYAIALMPL